MTTTQAPGFSPQLFATALPTFPEIGMLVDA
jgi:hypothetical protein